MTIRSATRGSIDRIAQIADDLQAGDSDGAGRAANIRSAAKVQRLTIDILNDAAAAQQRAAMYRQGCADVQRRKQQRPGQHSFRAVRLHDLVGEANGRVRSMGYAQGVFQVDYLIAFVTGMKNFVQIMARVRLRR